MIIVELKAYGKPHKYQAIDEAIRTVKFIRNSCIRLWMDNKGTGKYDLSKYCKILAKEFPFANELNSTARQAAAERAWLEVTVRIVEPYFMSFNPFLHSLSPIKAPLF
ncbi:transposase [Moorena bouillonii PNG]|uniref:Transposase n=1 Tax=Moorena bouillonii PNG TaxID=568701 RepID=A0A1U7MX70_9CYAN|nr:transposase [Moorena bouillonii PNG]